MASSRMGRIAVGLACLAGAPTTQAAVDIVAMYSRFALDARLCDSASASSARVQSFGSNEGDADHRGVVDVLWFQDTDADGGHSPGDVTIARATIGTYWPPGRIMDATGQLSPLLPEPLSPVWVMFDPDDLIAEDDETNNAAMAGYPCSAADDPLRPLANLVLSLTSVVVVPEGPPGCSARAVIDARVTNTGSLDPGGYVRAWAYPRAPVAPADVLVPPPGGSTDFTLEVPLDAPTIITVAIDDDGTSTGIIEECVEIDNRCTIPADPGSATLSMARPIGPALRATGHSDPYAAIITADFNWLLDAGAPRPASDSFVVFQSTAPWQLDEVVIVPPLRQPRWTSATPRGTLDPTVHFILVAAADECGRMAE